MARRPDPKDGEIDGQADSFVQKKFVLFLAGLEHERAVITAFAWLWF